MGRAARVMLAAALLGVLGIVGEGFYWTRAHGYPLGVLPERWEYEIGLYKSWPKLAAAPAGSFAMGDAGNGTRQVSFAQASYVASTEITFAQYDLFAIATGRPLPADNGWGRSDRPVINVDWSDAAAYAAWLSASTGNRCRLPSEAEWEYACRAGTTTQFAVPAETGGSDDIAAKGLANCKLCGGEWEPRRSTAPVGQFKPNAWGLFDMHGNVWEWVADCWRDDYQAVADGERAPADASCPHGLRGGSWNSRPHHLPCAYRLPFATVNRLDVVGFRVVCAAGSF